MFEASTIIQYGASEDGWVCIVANASATLVAWNAPRASSLAWKEPRTCFAERSSEDVTVVHNVEENDVKN